MAVYFVYRCHYGAPSEKHIRRFEYDTVLEWAQAVWKQFETDDAAYDYARDLLGGLEVYSFGSMFYTPPEYSPGPGRPETMEAVHEWFRAMYGDESANGPHHVQVLTDDDELEMAVYLFDDHFRAANPGKADFLLLDGWVLPVGDADGVFVKPPGVRVVDLNGVLNPGELPVTYAAFLAHYDSSNLNDLSGGYRVAQTRLPDLARYILAEWADTEMDGEWEAIREGLRDALRIRGDDAAGFIAAVRDNPAESTHWAAWTDWLAERDEPAPGLRLLRAAFESVDPHDGSTRPSRDPSKDMFRITPHMAQAVFHTANWNDDLYHQWIFFDDRWAAAHPTLAAGILTFASRWDVLT